MRKMLVALGVLTAAVVWNHSLNTDNNINAAKEETSSSTDSKSGTKELSSKDKDTKDGEKAVADSKSKNSKENSKIFNKKKLKKVAMLKKKKRSRRNKRKINDNPFEANFDHLPDYTVYKGDSDFQEEMKDPGSL